MDKRSKATTMYIESFIKEGINKEGVNTLVFPKTQTKDIIELVDKIVDTFEKGDRYNAANNYLQILNKCLSCHQTV